MDSYEMRELMDFRKQMELTEKLSLAERKANAVEWFRALNEDHMMVAQRVGWLLNGSYGKGSFDSACRVLASPRMNQVAWCAITIASLEWRCPAKFAIQAWKKLSIEKRYLVNEAIRQEIADAKREGYCGEIKKNPGKYIYTSQAQLRRAFWESFPGLSRKKLEVGYGGKRSYVTDTRIAWVDFIDSLSRNGMISEELASRATL